MGYETIMYVVKVYDHDTRYSIDFNPDVEIDEDLVRDDYMMKDGKVLIMGSIIGMVDLCNAGNGVFEELRSANKDAQKNVDYVPYVYASNGNDKITEDKYGDRLVMMKPSEVLEALKENNESYTYRRFTAAIGLLENTITHFDDQLRVFTFGY